MLTVTDTVLEKFNQAIANASEEEARDKCIRLVEGEEDGLALKLEEPADDDRKFEYAGRTVLAVPESSERLCGDRTMDINRNGDVVLA